MRFATLIIAAVSAAASCLPARAELKLVSINNIAIESGYGQAHTREGVAYWMTPRLQGDSTALRLQLLTAGDSAKPKETDIGLRPLALAQRSTAGAGELLVLASDGRTPWQAILINERAGTLKKKTAIDGLAFAVEATAMDGGYAVGGTDAQEGPTVVLLGTALDIRKAVRVGGKAGEVSSVFVRQGKLVAVANYSDATSALQEISAAGDLGASVPLKGGATTGIALKDGGVALTYRLGREIFLDRLDANLKPVWSVKLHDVKGIGTKKNQLVELPNGIGVVGANDNHLVVTRVTGDGKTVQRAIDTASGLRVPPTGFYSSTAVENAIHIRGQARKVGAPVDGSIEFFYFVDSAASAPPVRP